MAGQKISIRETINSNENYPDDVAFALDSKGDFITDKNEKILTRKEFKEIQNARTES
jgi:hypothetical protein